MRTGCSNRHCMILHWLLDVRWRIVFSAALRRTGSGCCWWEPDHHSKSWSEAWGYWLYHDFQQMPRSPWPTTQRWRIADTFFFFFSSRVFFRSKAWQQNLVFSSDQVKEPVCSLHIKHWDQKMHWFHLAAVRVNWWRAKVTLPFTSCRADTQKISNT